MSITPPEPFTLDEFPDSKLTMSSGPEEALTTGKNTSSDSRLSPPLSPIAHPKRPIKGDSKDKKRAPKRVKLKNHGLENNLFDDIKAGEKRSQPKQHDADKSRDRVLRKLQAACSPKDLKQFRRDKMEFLAAAKSVGHAAVKPVDNGLWKIPGIKTPLKSHQVMGAGRALAIERRKSGVLVADQMGLGKTLQALASIANSRPSRRKDDILPTLIVSTPNNHIQWKDEILKHCVTLKPTEMNSPGIGRVVAWRKADAATRFLDPLYELLTAHIVLTTYSEVVESDKKSGLLHQVKFYRIILDEAHLIRNPSSATAVACHALQSHRAWVMTGTPLVNGTEDLYSQLKFIKHKACLSEEELKDSSAEDLFNLHSGTLQKCTIYRTYATSLFGGPLVKLPPMQRTEIRFALEGLEREVYLKFHNAFAKVIEEIDDEGEKAERIFGLCLRLRQLVSHPKMLQITLCEFLKQDEVKDFLEVLDENRYEDERDRTLARLLNRAIKKFELEKEMRSLTDPNKSVLCYPNCVSCKKPSQHPRKASCTHVYCSQCLQDLRKRLGPGTVLCNACLGVINHDECYIHENEAELDRQARSRSSNVRKGKSSEGMLDEWRDAKGKVYRSAKVAETVRRTKAFLSLPGNKNKRIIWFCQWLGLAEVLVEVCKEERWQCLQYHGSLSSEQKDKAIVDFGDPAKKKRVLIMSLKAGGVGLNLTVASMVIIVDHWRVTFQAYLSHVNIAR